jgi:flavin reductase (DIM6/NTAB) family NADH-FMN oxidoreductase RutF
MPVVSYASLSASPPLVVVGCNPSSFTCKLASRARAFSLCLLDRAFLPAMERLASGTGAGTKDKLKVAGLAYAMGSQLDVPVISGAKATLECQLKSKQKLGDHLLIIGRVKRADASEAFSDFWDFRRYNPILYTGWRDKMTTFAATRRTT